MPSDKVNSHISFEVVWTDPHLIELRGHLNYEGWSGITRAYSTSLEISQLCSSLLQFNDAVNGEVAFQAGDPGGAGMIALWFYRYDSAGHVACHVRMESKVATEHRPEEVFTLAVEAKRSRLLSTGLLGNSNKSPRSNPVPRHWC